MIVEMISDDEYLERIVAGIHAVTTERAEVRWNQSLNGRQFDVIMRFHQGTMTYLVLVEVKNRTRRASAEDLDAFVTKSRDQNANKAVFVTTAGFQSGALAVARKHGVELFTVSFAEEEVIFPEQTPLVSFAQRAPVTGEVPRLELGERQLAANIVGAKLIYQDGTVAEVPCEQTQMNYYVNRSELADGRSLRDLFRPEFADGIKLNERRTKSVRLRPIQRLTPPDDYFFPTGKLKSIEFTIVGVMGRGMFGNILIDPGFFTSPIVYTNAITGAEHRFHIDKLPLNFGPPEEGSFFQLEHPLRYFYCETVNADQITWILIESFQAGSFFQARFEQNIQYAHHMMPVRDKITLTRLKRRLDAFKKLPSAQGFPS